MAKAQESTKKNSDPESVTLRVRDLSAAKHKVASVKPRDTIAKAATLMVARNFSQLAVVANDRACHGIIGWESIGRARLSGLALETVNQAIVSAPTVDLDAPLLGQIQNIYDHGLVLVRGPDKKHVQSIITASDLTLQFGDLVRPFMLIEETERRLRHCVDKTFTPEEIRPFTRFENSSRTVSAADLSLGRYTYLFDDEQSWAKLKWEVDRQEFIELFK